MLRIGGLRLLFGVGLGISGQVSSLIYTVIHLERLSSLSSYPY
jgi:hypothetical protein